MTIIELIVYIGLTALILSGSIFSAYGIMLSREKSQADWQHLNEELQAQTRRDHERTYEDGFVALISAVLVSAALMAVALAGSSDIAAIFDQVNRKEYRFEAYQAAASCLDQVFIELSHDYFYSVDGAGVYYPDIGTGVGCTVVSVTAEASSTRPLGSVKSVIVSGILTGSQYHITARMHAQVLLEDTKISLVSETTEF